jgi:hypothetical protein
MWVSLVYFSLFISSTVKSATVCALLYKVGPTSSVFYDRRSSTPVVLGFFDGYCSRNRSNNFRVIISSMERYTPVINEILRNISMPSSTVAAPFVGYTKPHEIEIRLKHQQSWSGPFASARPTTESHQRLMTAVAHCRIIWLKMPVISLYVKSKFLLSTKTVKGANLLTSS